MQEADPARRRVRILHHEKIVWSEVLDHNPRLALPNEKGDFLLHHARSVATNMRDYHTRKTGDRWFYNLNFRAKRGEIYLTPAEKDFGAMHSPGIILSASVKPNASPNKKWIAEYWPQLVKLAKAAGLKLSQFAYPGATILDDVETIQTPSFRLGASVMEKADAVVTTEGGISHLSAALNVPAVVLFGGFTPRSLTSYDGQIALGGRDEDACGLRVPCPHCQQEMRRISPQQVFQSLQEILQCPRN